MDTTFKTINVFKANLQGDQMKKAFRRSDDSRIAILWFLKEIL